MNSRVVVIMDGGGPMVAGQTMSMWGGEYSLPR